MIDNVAFVVIFNIVPAIKTTIPKHVFNFDTLVWGLWILWPNLYVFSCFDPWLTFNHTLLSLRFLHLEFLITDSMLDAHLNITNVCFNFLIMPLHFIANVRVHQVIHVTLEIQLPLRDEPHVEHPFFVVFVLQADFNELALIK